MVELDQFKYTLNTYETPLAELKDSLDLESKAKRIQELEREMEEPNYWDNAEKSQMGMKELSALKEESGTYYALETQFEDIATLIEMGYEEEDVSLIPEIEQELKEFQEYLTNAGIQLYW